MRDYLKGKRCMVWSFKGNARMYQALRDYGDRLDTVGIFTFEVSASGTISETGTSISLRWSSFIVTLTRKSFFVSCLHPFFKWSQIIIRRVWADMIIINIHIIFGCMIQFLIR